MAPCRSGLLCQGRRNFRPHLKFPRGSPITLQIHSMNASASSLLQTLSMVGVRSVQFRMLSQRNIGKHTTPVALGEEEDTSHRMPRFSVADLFAAYSLQ